MGGSTKAGAEYEEAVRNEVLRSLGFAIHEFRNIKRAILANHLPTEVNVLKAIDVVDAVYQNRLTDIFDALVNCRDMRLSRAAIDGIRQATDQSRGFRRVDKK